MNSKNVLLVRDFVELRLVRQSSCQPFRGNDTEVKPWTELNRAQYAVYVVSSLPFSSTNLSSGIIIYINHVHTLIIVQKWRTR